MNKENIPKIKKSKRSSSPLVRVNNKRSVRSLSEHVVDKELYDQHQRQRSKDKRGRNDMDSTEIKAKRKQWMIPVQSHSKSTSNSSSSKSKSRRNGSSKSPMMRLKPAPGSSSVRHSRSPSERGQKLNGNSGRKIIRSPMRSSMNIKNPISPLSPFSPLSATQSLPRIGVKPYKSMKDRKVRRRRGILKEDIDSEHT